MNYNWTNNAYWLLRLRLKPGALAEVRSIAQALPGSLAGDALVGQSRSPNIVPFHMFGIVSHCAIVTLSSRQDFVFTIFDFKKCRDLEIGVKVH